MSSHATVTVVEVDPYEGWTGWPEHPPMLDWWCAYHHRQEIPSHPDMAVVCGECLHVFASPADVVAQFEQLGMGRREFKDIYACPVCSHDF